DFIFPSCGSNDAGDFGDRPTITTAVMNIANAADSRGACIFTLDDWNTTIPLHTTWGMYNSSFVTRPSVVPYFQAGIIQTHPKHPMRRYPGQPRLNALHAWGYK